MLGEIYNLHTYTGWPVAVQNPYKKSVLTKKHIIWKIRTKYVQIKNPYTAKISDIQEIGTKKCVFWQSLPVPKLSFCIQLCYHSGLTYYKTFFKYLKEPFLPLIMHCVRILFSFQPYNINFSFLPFAINGEKRKVFNILYIH